MSYRCPKCSAEFFVMGVLSRHIMQKHPELTEEIVSNAMEQHAFLGSWGE